MSPQLSRRRFIDLGFFLIAVGLLVWLLHRVGWSEIGRALLGIGLGGAAVIAALGMVETVLDGTALWIAMSGAFGWSRVVATNSVGALVNMLLPWDLGELAKGTLVRQRAGGVSGVIIWNYLFKLSRPIVSLAAVVVGLILGSGMDDWTVRLVLIANLLAFLPYVLLRLLVRQGAAGLVIRLLSAIRLLGKRREQLASAAARIDTEVHKFWRERPGSYVALLAAQMGARVASWLSLFAITEALGLGYSFGRVAFLYASLNVAEFMVSALPSRLGVTEGTAYALFKLFGLPPEPAVIIYVVLRLKALLVNGVVVPFASLRRP